MKHIFSKLLTGTLSLYALSILIFMPYFNWQYAKENAFIKWLILGQIVPTAKSLIWPYYVLYSDPGQPVAGDKSSNVAEYTDNEYNYAFQFPSTWKMKPPPAKQEGDLGEARVFISAPRATLMAVVGQIGKTVAEAAYRSNPDSERVVKALIDLSVEQYKKVSKSLNAGRMIVNETKVMPSNKGIRFYITTTHFIDDKPPVIIIGTHLVPFDKPYMIVFMINILVDKRMKEDQNTYDNIFNSFHLIGETPDAKP